MRSAIGFTLIELLVVITIIVILLALLTPALDKAIYMATLASDGSQMRAVTQGTLAYSAQFQQKYPERGTASSWDAMQLRNASHWNIPGRLSPYVALDAFSDPFLDYQIRDDECMADPYGVFMPGYHMYLDWGGGQYNIGRMQRIGQKMTFVDPATDELRKFGVIIADRDARHPGVWSTTSHQDKEGLQRLWVYQGGGNPWRAQGLGPAVGPATGNVYVAWWVSDGTSGGGKRGTVDNNYGLDDGSVLRLMDVPIVQATSDDDRITFIPDVLGNGEYDGGRKAQLPRGN